MIQPLIFQYLGTTFTPRNTANSRDQAFDHEVPPRLGHLEADAEDVGASARRRLHENVGCTLLSTWVPHQRDLLNVKLLEALCFG